jgi:hypothetical protein
MVDVGLDESSVLEDECLFTSLLMFDMKSTSAPHESWGSAPEYYPKILCIMVAEALYFRD